MRPLRRPADDLPHVWPSLLAEDGLGVCELCFFGATDEQIAACEMVVDPEDLESKLLDQVEKKTGSRGRTIVAYSLLRQPLLKES
jgi:hypothetical protein